MTDVTQEQADRAKRYAEALSRLEQAGADLDAIGQDGAAPHGSSATAVKEAVEAAISSAVAATILDVPDSPRAERLFDEAMSAVDRLERALAEERAKVARVEALADAFEQEELDLGAASYHLAGDTRDASDELARESETWRTAATRVRAALADDDA